MATFVLVHGAWHGGWCYKRVAARLRADGHDVFCPSLSGLADRSHLVGRDIDLSTHVADVANLIKWEELSDVVLAGHSYGGMVITGAGDAVAERIKSLVYIDAFVPSDGQAVFDIMAPERQAMFVASAEANGGCMTPVPAEGFNVNAADRAWVDAQCTLHPITCFREKLRLTGAVDGIAAKHYLLAEGWSPSAFPAIAERLRGQPGWSVEGFACGHDIMVDMPDALADALVRIAG